MNVKLLTIALISLAVSALNAGLTFGLAGHSGFPAQSPYPTLGFDGEIVRLKDLKMTVYRSAGLTWEFPSLGEYAQDKLRLYVDKMHAAGIEPIIVLNPAPQEKMGETDAYNSAYNLGRYVAQTLAGKGIKYWEIGNEFDIGMVIANDGHLPSDYDTTKYKKARGTVKGLMIGIRSVTTFGKFLVGASGTHWGFTQRLYNDGVRWDYTKFHWYSKNDRTSTAPPATDFGPDGGLRYNLLKILRDAFHRPLFCTEVGASPEQFDYDDTKEAAWLKRLMTDWTSVASTYDLRFACIYEMLDQPEKSEPLQKDRGLFRGDAGHIGEDKPQAVAVRVWMNNTALNTTSTTAE